jgi:hypothetical protein
MLRKDVDMRLTLQAFPIARAPQDADDSTRAGIAC